jgi:hypothetical protein
VLGVTTFDGREETIPPVLKVSRQCAFAFLVEVMPMIEINLVCRWMGSIIMQFGLMLGGQY